MEDIILTPFCFESIIMYHKLRLQGYNVISFLIEIFIYKENI